MGIFHNNFFYRKNKEWKNKKTFVDRNGDSDRRGDRISHLHTQEDQDFSATVPVDQLIVDKSSESRSVDLTNNGMDNDYLRRRPWFHTVFHTTVHHLSQTCPIRHLKVQPNYAGFNACSEFFRLYGLLDWTTLIFSGNKTNKQTERQRIRGLKPLEASMLSPWNHMSMEHQLQLL